MDTNEFYSDDSAFEKENLYGNGYIGEAEITEPFDPKDVDIISNTMVVSNIIDRLKDGRIILDPDFQRRPDLWNLQKQSRLIESLIIRIPLPSFYFDYDDTNDNYIVVDGLQRLRAIQRFAALDASNPERLRLTGLEYLTEFEGKTYDELPKNLQRRIREQTIIAYVIRPGTPESVRNSIFTRINTGGTQLTPAEIKNSVYRGQAADFLKELAHSESFIRATNQKIKPDRMLDCEFVNRFLAFYLLDMDDYRDNLEQFFNNVLLRLKEASRQELNDYRQAFYKSMETAYTVFGKNAFRKLQANQKYGRINKPLFECVSVCFARLTNKECAKLCQKKSIFVNKYEQLLKTDAFIDVITNGTAKRSSIEQRNKELNRIIYETIK